MKTFVIKNNFKVIHFIILFYFHFHFFFFFYYYDYSYYQKRDAKNSNKFEEKSP